MAFLYIKIDDFLIFLAKTPENKKYHFISIIWMEGGKFDPLSSRSNGKIVVLLVNSVLLTSINFSKVQFTSTHLNLY